MEKAKAFALHMKQTSADPYRILHGFLNLALAFILGLAELPFSVYPMGIAFLCATTTGVFYSVLGILLAAFFSSAPTGIYISVCFITLIVRFLARLFVDIPVKVGESGLSAAIEHIRGRVFCEHLSLRMATSSVSAFVMSVYAMVVGGFRYYDLFGALLSVIVAPIMTWIYSGIFADSYGAESTEKAKAFFERLAMIGLSVSVVYTLKNEGFFGISIALAVAFLCVVLTCRRYGLIASVICGGLCGAVFDLAYIPALIAVAITMYCLSDISPFLATSISCITGTTCGVLIVGGAKLTYIFIPFFIGTAAYCTVGKMMSRGELSSLFSKVYNMPCGEVLIGRAKNKYLLNKIHKAEDSFLEISDFFREMSEKMKNPGITDYKRICKEAFDEICTCCPDCEICRGEKGESIKNCISMLSHELKKNGSVRNDKITSELGEVCGLHERIIDEVQLRNSTLLREYREGEKNAVFASNFRFSSSAMTEICQRFSGEFKNDPRLCGIISEKLNEIGYPARSVEVYGERNKKIIFYGMAVLPEHGKLRYIRSCLEKACGFPLTEIETSLLDGITVFECERAECYRAEVGSCVGAYDYVCGDSVRVFEEESSIYAIIGDGMGTGSEAAMTSGSGIGLLEKLLRAGFGAETSLRLLNVFLREGRNCGCSLHECSTTVDMLKLDLMMGEAVFIKSGAAPTYVKRGKNIFKLTSKTMPVGIISETDAKQIDFDVDEKDIIFMVSDGIMDCNNECVWLLDYISTLDNNELLSPQEIAEHIVKMAREKGSCDDISAVVIGNIRKMS